MSMTGMLKIVDKQRTLVSIALVFSVDSVWGHFSVGCLATLICVGSVFGVGCVATLICVVPVNLRAQH